MEKLKRIFYRKKSTSNIEIVLSFVIFIGFMFFMFMAFPLKNIEKSSVGLDAAQRGIFNYTETEILYVSAVFNESEIASKNNAGCFYFNPGINFDKIIVKDENNNLINANGKYPKIYIKSAEKFYQIYSSPYLEENSFSDAGCREITGNFELGTPRKYNVLLYDKIEELNSVYSSDYSGLHISFNMPKRDNFGFVLRNVDGHEIISALKSKGDKSNVLSRDVPVQIMYSNGTLDYAILNIRNW